MWKRKLAAIAFEQRPAAQRSKRCIELRRLFAAASTRAGIFRQAKPFHHFLEGLPRDPKALCRAGLTAGVADGLGYGANTRCALITRSLAEIMRLGMAMGGRQQTFMGLAGLGDLILTCTDNQSRNRRFGIALAEGKDIETAKQEIGQAIEGAVTTSVVSELAKTYNIEMPITEQVNNVLNSNCSPREAVQNLLAREPKAEM